MFVPHFASASRADQDAVIATMTKATRQDVITQLVGMHDVSRSPMQRDRFQCIIDRIAHSWEEE